MQPSTRDKLSTSRVTNLTCTLASVSALFSAFLLRADKESYAIRHYAIQSIALCVLFLAAQLALWLLRLIFGWIPILGAIVSGATWVVAIAVALVYCVTRWRMMRFAYQGDAYLLPLVGLKIANRFE